MNKRILTICGSTKANSTNEIVLKMIEAMAEGRAEFDSYDISALPFFNIDLDNERVPDAVIDYLSRLADADAVIICTPEYVFSLPGVLKNALEWTVSSSGFSDKPVALIVAASLGEKTFESLQLVMRAIEARFDVDTTLLLQGAKARIESQETSARLSKLFNSLMERL